MNRRGVSLAVLFFWLASGLGLPVVPGSAASPVTTDGGMPRNVGVNAKVDDDASSMIAPSDVGDDPNGLAIGAAPQVQTNVTPLSPDHDYDGLTDGVEQNGWRNVAGFFVTDPLDVDGDDDGLTDGQEKLFDTDPLDDTSPGIYVEYSDDLKTSKYFSWQRYGGQFIAFDSVVVRRGSTFYVGGPADATIQVEKSRSSLTTLTPRRDVCAGRWRISVPADGTVGKYTITLERGAWSESLELYVIFELSTSLSAAGVAAYSYGDGVDSFRDEYAIWFMTGNDDDYSWSLNPAYHKTRGSGFAFQTDHYQAYVFEEHVIDVINGYSSPWDAANALGYHLDEILRFESRSVEMNMWETLHAYNDEAQCSTHACALTSLIRGAGIPARPVLCDWDMYVVSSLFDHATEVWLSGRWRVMRAFRRNESLPGEPIDGGIYTLRERTDWFYHDSSADIIAIADPGWVWEQMQTDWGGSSQTDYWFGNYNRWEIIRWDWVETEVIPYGWGWSQEPADIGDPYIDSLDWPYNVRAYSEGATLAPVSQNTENMLYLPLVSKEVQKRAVQLGRVVGDYGLDLDGNGRFDQLAVEVEVYCILPGYYSIGGLIDSPAFTAYAGIPALSSAASYTYLEAGSQTVSLLFDGTSISLSRVDGPYEVKGLWVSDLDLAADPIELAVNMLDEKDPAYATAAYRATDFETLGATFTDEYSERGVDSDHDGRYESLAIDIGLELSTPGTYTVIGDLYDRRGQFVSRATWTGSHALASLQFDGIPGMAGPYTLQNLYLLDDAGEIVDSRVQAYATRHLTGAEGRTRIVGQAGLSEFEIQSVLPDAYSDAGVDADGDGLYDLLAINVQVEVEEAGQHWLEGWLEGEDGSLISWASSDPVTLTVGTHILSLAFSGPAIGARNTDGHFTLMALKLLTGDGHEALDEVDVAYSTSAYTHDQFENPSFLDLPADRVVLFEDPMESGGNNWTADSPWTLVTAQYHSPTHSWTDSPEGEYANSSDVSLTSGPVYLGQSSRPVLQFQTCYDLEADHDYGHVELSTDGGVTWTEVAAYTGRSARWSRETVDLDVIDDAETLQVRFRLDTDAGTAADGWYIDDVAVYSENDLADDLHGYWTLDQVGGERLDSSGHGNDLMDNNLVGSIAGRIGLAADFESDNGEYLSIGDGVQHGLDITGSLTLVGWVNPESLDRDQIMVAKCESGVNDCAYSFALRPGNFELAVSPDGTSIDGCLVEASAPFSLSPGTWYHVAGVFDVGQGTLSVYVGGALVGSCPVAFDTIYDSSAPFMLGASLENGNAVQHLDGQLDEWRVYSRALTEGEIETLVAVPQEPISGLAASNDGPSILGGSTTLMASIDSGSDVVYVWNLGDGSPLENGGPVFSHAYPAAGTFTAIVQAFNDVNSQSASTVVVQEAPPVAAFTTSSPDYLGQVTTFSNASTGGNLSFEWDFGDASPVETSVHPAHTYVATGTFTVALTAINNAGTSTTSAQVIIREPLPTLRGHWTLDEAGGQRADDSSYANHLMDHNTVGSATGELGLAADFERNDVEYLAIGDDIQAGLNITADLTLAGWVRPESSSGYMMMASKYDWGSAKRAYRFGLVDNRLQFILSRDGQYLSDYNLNGETYVGTAVWRHVAAVFDASNQTMSIYIDGVLEATRSVDLSSIYVSTAPFMLGANVQSDSVTQHFDGQLDEWYVFADALSEGEIEDLMVLAQEPVGGLVVGNDGPTGLGEATGLTASVTSGSHVRYAWDLGDGSWLEDSGPAVSHVYPAVGTFTAVVTASNDVSSESAVTTVVIEEVPPVAGFTSSSPDVVGEATVFKNESSGSNLGFEWDFGDGSPRESGVDPSHTYAVTGTYTVVLSATNSVGSDTALGEVVIVDQPIAPPSLRGHWRLDEAVGQREDSSSYGNHLTEYNTVGSVAGQVDEAADLERYDGEYLAIGDGVQHGLDITGSLTLVGWMNPESQDRDQMMAAKYEFGVENRAYRLYLRYNNVLAFLVSPDGSYDSGDLLQASLPGGLSPGTWYHVAGVFDAEERTLSIYLDGDLIGSRSVTYDAIYDSSAPFMLGANLYGGQVIQHFDGQLDEWYVFADALSEGEIEDLMAMAAP